MVEQSIPNKKHRIKSTLKNENISSKEGITTVQIHKNSVFKYEILNSEKIAFGYVGVLETFFL